MAASDVLRQMINVSDDQVADIESSIDQINELILDTQTQIDGLQDGMCGVDETSMTIYLQDVKLPEIEALYGIPGVNTPFSVDYGPDYGTINYVSGGIDDWAIVDSTGNTMYKYLGTNWDNDITAAGFITDYDFANDYLTRPLTSGASYGLKPYKSNLISAKSLLTQNKNKIAASKTVLEDYAS